MKFRPEEHLHRLRTMLHDDEHSTAAAVAAGREPAAIGNSSQQLLLPWLRTLVLNTRGLSPSEGEQQIALQMRHAILIRGAVEHVVLQGLEAPHVSQVLPFVTETVLVLHSLDVKRCEPQALTSAFFSAVAKAHSRSLKRLILPPESITLSQELLENFTRLEALHIEGNPNLTSVEFCAETLRMLYASYCPHLRDEGLRNAIRLEVLHVSNCPQVTDISSFAHNLLELGAAGDYDLSYACFLNDTNLAGCQRLQVLSAFNNENITSLEPFAHCLREFNAGGSYNQFTDAALANATRLVRFEAFSNPHLSTLAPFAPSLRHLDVGNTYFDDAALANAGELVVLHANGNYKISTLAPFAGSLMELDARDTSVLGLAAVEQIAGTARWLDVTGSMHVWQVAETFLRGGAVAHKDCCRGVEDDEDRWPTDYESTIREARLQRFL